MQDSKVVYVVVQSSEDQDFSEIDMYQELLDGNVLFFEDIEEILDYHKNDEDLENDKVFTLTIGKFGEVVNNPKIVKVELPQSKKVKKK